MATSPYLAAIATCIPAANMGPRHVLTIFH